MARKFGLTWWGQRWLDSLSGIDYSNRLPRGASYARGGRVLGFTIEGNTVQAKVAGHYASAYRVRLTLPEIPKAKVQALAEALQKRPALLSKLLNRELSPEISEIAESLDIKLFPSKWKDLGMSCNCPDGAVPCKHLAAVIYILSQEIDNNPFLIFTLRGVDLLAELQSGDTALPVEELPAPVLFPDFLAKDELRNPPENPAPIEDKALLSSLDYSVLPSLTDLLPSLLQPSPPFYGNGDFRNLYQQALSKASTSARRLLSDPLFLDQLLPACNLVDKHSNFHLVLRGDLTTDLLPLTDSPTSDIPSLAIFLGDLLHLPQETLPHCQPSILALRQCAICALQLIANGAILPHIVTLSNGNIAIRWIPALLDPSIQNILQTLSTTLPADLIRGKKIRKTFPLAHPTDWIVSLFISTLLPLLLNPKFDPVSRLFFAAETAPFNEAGEKEIPGGIKAWTDRLFLEQSRFTPVFLVDETAAEGEFLATLGVIDKESKHPETIPLADFLASRKNKSLHVPALRSFAQLSQLVDGLDETIASNGKTPISLSGEKLITFLLQTVPAIRLLKAQVLLPRSIRTLLRPKPTIRLKQKAAKGKNANSIRLDELLDFDWQVALGDESVSLDEFSRLAQDAQGLLYYKGRYIYLSVEDIEKLRKATNRRASLTPAELLQAALSDEIGRTPITLSPEVKKLIKVFTEQDEIPLPADLHATLRPYQERGYSWLYRNQRIGFGSILADDMGLGKTIQLITLLLKLKEEGALEKKKALIVAPTGLLTNWEAELERFAPTLTHRIYHGPDRHLEPLNTDILISSYGIVRSDAEELAQKDWEMIVIDEAQNIKNQNTAQSKAVRNIPATTHIALSGTPVENRLSEFWSIMDFVNRGYLGTDKHFEAEYARPIQNSGDRQLAERFRKITAPFMMRRLKSDKSIISDLPDKIELNRFAQLTPTQASLYQETLTKAMTDIEGIEGQDPQSLFKREGLVLQLILALKQICNHPAHFLKNDDLDPTHSGKTQMLLDLIDSITASNEKALIFTQFREMGTLLQQFIAKRTGETPMFYHGGTSIKQRNEFIQRFQNNPADQLFILSLKAAGTGLNLTAASHVIHYDLWWNPAVEAQATDRAYRIGQTKNVVVHRFITKNTFEERIDRLISEKKALANLTVSSGENWIGKLSNSELRELFG